MTWGEKMHGVLWGDKNLNKGVSAKTGSDL